MKDIGLAYSISFIIHEQEDSISVAVAINSSLYHSKMEGNQLNTTVF